MEIYRKISFVFFAIMLGQSLLVAQDDLNLSKSAGKKSVTPISNAANKTPNSTRALVVGISDYQDPAIPNLRFAEKDAESFAGFLRSPAGGSLDGDHMKLLLGKQATTAQFAAALDWLVEQSAEGDQAVIYFSGHGDVETTTRNQLGFLLTWDSPPQTYIAGAFPLFYLQEIISTLSLANKAHVLIITDACRAGKLAGAGVGGAQATAANLSKQFAQEIKILSCQPNEYAIEGEQWGGGRGAFSYHLVNGLYGMADANNDKSVSLFEIGRYLEDHVTPEVAPQSQSPMTIGNKVEKLATVLPDLLAAIQKSQGNQLPLIAQSESRGLEEQVLAGADDATRMLYKAFKSALKSKAFFTPSDESADTCYEQLLQVERLRPFYAAIRHNYAAALQDESQQALNAWLKTDIREITLSRLKRFEKYRDYARYLERAAELLGPDHYMYRSLMGRKCLFEGYMARLGNLWATDPVQGQAVLQKYRESLAWQPDVPHTYLFMANNFGWNLGQPDSAYLYAMKAAEHAPNWVLPYTNTAYLLIMRYKQFDRARQLLDRALANDSSSAVVWNYFGVWHYKQEQYDEAEQCYRHAARLDTAFHYAWSNLGLIYVDTRRFGEAEQMFLHALALDATQVDANNNLGWLYVNIHRWTEAEKYFQQVIAIDPSYPFAWNNLGNVYLNTGRYAEAETVIRKSIALDTTNAYACNNLGQVYQRTGRLAEAEAWFLKAIAKAPGFGEPHYHLACLEGDRKQADRAMMQIKQALEKGYRDFDSLQRASELAPLREQTAPWKALMKQYFPDQGID